MAVSEHTIKVHADTTEALGPIRDLMRARYEDRYKAINDALWLVQHGPAIPAPPAPDARSQDYATGGFISGSTTRDGDPRYAEISLALDIARFLLDEELDDEDETEAEEQQITSDIKDLIARGRHGLGLR